jgi:octaprenyl-diphosphate synthase
VGDDLAEGKPTLPLIHAMDTGTSEERMIIRECIRKGGLVNLEQVLKIIQRTRSIDYVTDKARHHAHLAKQALKIFDDGESKQAMLALADLAVARQS